MKIEKNVTSILREMLADPEKDWSNHIPFVRLTEGDFEKARTLIKKHCKNADRRDEVMELFANYKERYETNDFHRPEHLKDFVWWLDDKLRFRKQWETQKQIKKEIEEVFNTEKYYPKNTNQKKNVPEKVFLDFWGKILTARHGSLSSQIVWVGV